MINKILNKLNYQIVSTKNNYDQLIKKFIRKKNPIILDIGANVGQSVDRFKKLFDNPLILSFEPEINCFLKLKEKYFSNKNIRLYNFALSNKKTKKKFNIFANNVHSSFLEPNLNSKWFKIRNLKYNKKFYEKSIIVETETLDNFVKKKKINNIDLMKIDVQGYEDKVLLGCKKNLENIKIIELEIILGTRYDKSLSFFEIEKSLCDKFKLFAIDRHGDLLNHPTLALNCIYINKNYLKSFYEKN